MITQETVTSIHLAFSLQYISIVTKIDKTENANLRIKNNGHPFNGVGFCREDREPRSRSQNPDRVLNYSLP